MAVFTAEVSTVESPTDDTTQQNGGELLNRRLLKGDLLVLAEQYENSVDEYIRIIRHVNLVAISGTTIMMPCLFSQITATHLKIGHA